MPSGYTPRRADDWLPDLPQDRAEPRRALDSLTQHQQMLVELEALAVSLTTDFEPGYARQVRDIARRYA